MERRKRRKFTAEYKAEVVGLDVHLILDNYATHKTPVIKNWLAKRPRHHLHFTPTHGSWLNLVERWFGTLTGRQIKRGAHRSVAALKTAIKAFLVAHNEDPKPFTWTKSADEILASIARFAARSTEMQKIRHMKPTSDSRPSDIGPRIALQ